MKRNIGNKGITMIALIITVIILIILAGIGIGALTGERGILNKSRDARDVTNYQKARETLDVVLYDIQMKKARQGEEFILNEELASTIESYKEITSAKLTRGIIETVVDGYTFEVNADLGVNNDEETTRVEGREEDWEYDLETIPGYAILTKYKKPDQTQLIVPNYIAGVPVKKLGGDEEGGIWADSITEAGRIQSGTQPRDVRIQKTIQKVVVSPGIEEIGKYCFGYAEVLEEIYLPQGVLKIGMHAFNRSAAKELELRVNIPKTVTHVEMEIATPEDLKTADVKFYIERKEKEIPSTWNSYWNEYMNKDKILYGVSVTYKDGSFTVIE